MSGEVEAAFRAIALHRVPAAWAAASYPSLLPLGAYLADLAARVAMFQARQRPAAHELRVDCWVRAWLGSAANAMQC